MRKFIDLVERLAQGGRTDIAETRDYRTYQRHNFWYHPRTDAEINTTSEEHAHWLIDHPEQFGLTDKDIDDLRDDPDFEEDWCPPLIKLAAGIGWVRVKCEGYPGELTLALQGLDRQALRKAAKVYVARYAPKTLVVDDECDYLGDVWHHTLKDEQIDRYVRFGTLPR